MQEQKRVKDMQPPFQDEREGISATEIAEQSSGKEADEIQREMRRGGETGEAADERDIAGSSDSTDTPQGREETKNDTGGKANQNG